MDGVYRALFLLALGVFGSGVRAQQPDVVTRLERLTAAGNTTAARTLADSILASSKDGSDLFVEALYWHAVLDPTAAGAEREYLRLVVEYPLAPRASAALLRLAELELARKARDRAQRHLEKLIADYPESAQIARARYLAARLALDDGQTERACSLLAGARTSVDANEVELRNQIIYLHSSCGRPPVLVDSVRDTVVRDTAVRRPVRTTAGGRYAIQVAAYNTQSEARSLMQQLQRRGIAARVVGTQAPYRVRVGRYATREDARRAMTQAGLRGIIVENEP